MLNQKLKRSGKMKGRIDKWTDKYGNELDQAKKIVTDKNINLVNLSKATDIPYSTIRSYRFDPSKLNRASWQRIKLLSNAYIQSVVESKLDYDNMQTYPSKLMNMFKNWKLEAIENNQSVAAIEKIEEIVMSDPLAVAEIFEANKSE